MVTSMVLDVGLQHSGEARNTTDDLQFYLTRRYPIHHLETGKPLPGRPYQWPNGQGDVDKFIDGIENRDKWAQEHGHLYRVWAGMNPEM